MIDTRARGWTGDYVCKQSRTWCGQTHSMFPVLGLMQGSETLKINKNFQLFLAEILLRVLVFHKVTKFIIPIS